MLSFMAGSGFLTDRIFWVTLVRADASVALDNATAA